MQKVFKSLFTTTLLLVALVLIAQSPAKENSVLFTYGSNPVEVNEFEYVYKKNNINDENAFSKKSLEEYLELYINFRLKVKEAEALGMDTLKSIKDELKGYREQLAKSYLTDREVTDKLLMEAYERMKYEVRASHILFNIGGEGLPVDTLKAYKMALDFRKRIVNGGEDFEKVARENSADPSVKDNGGDIGYFTVLQTVYPFETAAYTTPAGEVSMPVRTRFGYHIIKVHDKRSAQGRINVAHILLKLPDNATPEQVAEVKKKADDISQQMEGGTSFEELARKHSEDKLSAGKGGVLPEFSTGKMVMEFEKAAFALQNDGDVSEPVKTDYGWHIIKRINKPGIPSYDEAKVELKKRLERDSRSELATHVLVNRIKKENNFKENLKNKDALFKKVEPELSNPKITIADKKGLEKPLFELAGKTYSQKDFVDFIEAQQSRKRDALPYKVYTDLYDKFVEKTVLDYQDRELENKYPEFKSLMREYRDGTLLFALTDQKVWSKALQDTAGLKAFHEKNKMAYMWDTRLDAVTFTAKDAKTAKAARKLIAKGKMTNEALLKKVNAKDSLNAVLTMQEGIYEKGQSQLLDKIEWKEGLSADFPNADGSITFVHVRKVIPPTPKTLEEARGFIVSDYQEYLEKEWIKELREKYPVIVNQDVFTTLIKEN